MMKWIKQIEANKEQEDNKPARRPEADIYTINTY